MTKQIEAIYENGVLRPVHPINIPEGEHLKLIVITHQDAKNGNAASSLAEIATLPIEGDSDTFSGRDHARIARTGMNTASFAACKKGRC
jgi:predicted DNA-binding antitoxin AbrB/MazE fold protein